jgi:hypothetical protein
MLANRLSFRNNIIARAEFRHQRFILNNSRSGWGWIALAAGMLIPALLVSFAYFVVGVLGLGELDMQNVYLRAFVNFGTVMMIVMNIALYLIVILITLGLSSNSIRREKAKKTWDTLLLTNVDSRQLVLGKWWASLQALWGDHFMVLILRLGLMSASVIGFSDHLAAPASGLSYGVGYALPLGVIIILFTVIDAMFTAALGVALPISDASDSVMGATVVSVRVFAFGAGIFYFFLIGTSIRVTGGFDYLIVSVIGLALFATATFAALRAAQYVAVKGQVSAPGQ